MQNQDTTTTIKFDGIAYQLEERHKLNLTELAAALGYHVSTVRRMKAAGCPFFGRFSSVQIVRQWEYHNPDWRRKGAVSRGSAR